MRLLSMLQTLANAFVASTVRDKAPTAPHKGSTKRNEPARNVAMPSIQLPSTGLCECKATKKRGRWPVAHRIDGLPMSATLRLCSKCGGYTKAVVA